MWNDSSNNKKVVFIAVFILLVFGFVFTKNIPVAMAQNDDPAIELEQWTEDVLSKTDTDSLDEFLPEESFVQMFSFKEFARSVLSGEYLADYDSVFEFIKDAFLINFKKNLRFFVYLFVCVVIYEIFKNFCADKYIEVKKNVKIIFCFLFCVILLSSFKTYYDEISGFVDGVFNFTAILFPILVGLVTMSGAATSASVYSSFSIFILNTGSYIIRFVLMPSAISIFILSLFGSILKNKRFDRVCEIVKLIFKYVVVLFFSVFGLLSFVNVVSTSSRDGLNLKLTKYAIKNYIPVLGGYISEGFDFLKGCSILVKNAFGFCSVLILISMAISPLLLTLVFVFGFKILSALTGYVGEGVFSDMFNDVSKAYSNFLTVIIGLFLIMFIFIFLMIMSVWVV